MFQHRFERFLELGFSNEEAHALASSVDRNGLPLYWGAVKQALDSGLDRGQALDIFISEGVKV